MDAFVKQSAQILKLLSSRRQQHKIQNWENIGKYARNNIGINSEAYASQNKIIGGLLICLFCSSKEYAHLLKLQSR